jgi:SPP1 family predicted phage head-tail adaptor
MEDRELAVLRKQTAAFIRDNPVTITLNRNVRTPNGKGGFTVTPTPQDPQTFRKVPVNAGQTQTRNIDGVEVQPKFVLIGPYDADVTNDDTFIIDGHNYNVDFVRDDHRYETWVEATYVG